MRSFGGVQRMTTTGVKTSRGSALASSAHASLSRSFDSTARGEKGFARRGPAHAAQLEALGDQRLAGRLDEPYLIGRPAAPETGAPPMPLLAEARRTATDICSARMRLCR
jgi:hypothetical protein